MESNISEKAQALKSKVEAELQEKREVETRLRVEELQAQIDTEKTIKENFNQKSNAVSQKKSEIEELLRTGKQERTVLQAEGKAINQEFRSSEAGNIVLKDTEKRDEIFGEAIAKLKEINEASKSYRAEITELLAEFKNDSGEYSKEKQERLIAFRTAHPEINKLQNVASEYDRQLKYLQSIEVEVKDFLADPEVVAHLDDEIEFNNYRIQDKTLRLQGEALDKRLSEIRQAFRLEEEEIKKMKKGFFESKDSFYAKQKQLFEDVRNREKEVERTIFHGPGSYQEIREIREKIEKKLPGFIGGWDYGEKEKTISEVKTVKGLAEKYQADLQERKKEYVLSEEEQALLELNRELWRS